ncbi:MAG: hypothetical protein JWO68_43 [Actinomycetia bacterium]|nr:hypothetical protein [Actinomycetes bacterium]
MTSTTAELTLERDAAQRQHRLATAVHGLRTRAGGTDGARLLLFFGGILIPLGFVVILLGWIGASRTVNLYEQIPYAISGGMFGLALVFAGGFCYFAYWLTQLVYAARRDATDTRIVLERIEELLASGASLSSVATPATSARAASATYLATPTGTMFHRADCPAVAGRDGLREVSGDEDGLTPCKICEPLAT